MRCPFCGKLDNKVVDSRVSKDASVIRRRRQCLDCDQRFTTYERVEEMETYVVKKDGSREVFDRAKLKAGVLKALHKRPVSIEKVDMFLDNLETSFQERNLREIPVRELGEAVMNLLKELDDVAYVRFASVYREFRDVDELMREVKKLVAQREEN
ncbi:MAG: transcriptional regulator NrdR [Desulfarculus sp.]|nr:transcriptional regulator NrdR [Pseudomonadota bacterium]MBV1714496.1 transcriptional regulator NrdR [Desulfarculus sp.]MBU4575025.1 transcriptional regulator NrdR [Pseudomonadota bacterium]MBU4599832.1 transcriptional regulator NrdR [Pseudomonadota bacterium]MBV1737117.1 transcriptional regulator NrdR [Desulfarculus sp.]